MSDSVNLVRDLRYSGRQCKHILNYTSSGVLASTALQHQLGHDRDGPQTPPFINRQLGGGKREASFLASVK